MNFQCKNENKRNNLQWPWSEQIIQNIILNNIQEVLAVAQTVMLLRNANAGGTVTFKLYNSKSTLWKITLL